MWTLRTTIALGLLAALLVVTTGATAVVVAHRPSERAYLQYVRAYGDYRGPDDPGVPHATRSQLLAAGARACGWVRDQPVALWRDDPRFRVDQLYVRYRRTLGAEDRALPEAFLPGALSYLCPLSTFVHKPHVTLLRRVTGTGASD